MGLGKIDYDQFTEFADKVHQTVEGNEFDQRIEKSLGQAAGYVIKSAKAKTPTKSGDLRRGWGHDPAKKQGNRFLVEIFNNVEYASFVEEGHRQTPGRYVPAIGKRLVASWVDGVFMFKKALDETEKIVNSNLEDDMDKAIQDIFGGM
jgi:hypothetical protein